MEKANSNRFQTSFLPQNADGRQSSPFAEEISKVETENSADKFDSKNVEEEISTISENFKKIQISLDSINWRLESIDSKSNDSAICRSSPELSDQEEDSNISYQAEEKESFGLYDLDEEVENTSSSKSEGEDEDEDEDEVSLTFSLPLEDYYENIDEVSSTSSSKSENEDGGEVSLISSSKSKNEIGAQFFLISLSKFEDGNEDEDQVSLASSSKSEVKDEDENEKEDKNEDENLVLMYKKCPYLNKPWTEIRGTVHGHLDNGHEISPIEDYQIPWRYKKLLKNDLEFTPDLNFQEQEFLRQLISKYEPERKRTNEEAFAYTAVNKNNYKEFFHDLLYFEEQEAIYRMANYNMFGVNVYVKSSYNYASKKVVVSKECTLHVPGLAEKRPSILIKDTVFVRLQSEPTIQYSGFVKDVGNEKIVIRGLCPDFLNRLFTAQNTRKPLLVDVRFTITRYPFFVQHRAFDLLSANVLDKLFPKEGNCGNCHDLLTREQLEEIEFINPDIQGNKEQKQAILNILKGSSWPAPYIIFGPPGTGKTVTFVEAILQVKITFPDSHILVCAQGNSACDHIATKLWESGVCKKDEILRLNSSARTEAIPPEIYNISKDCPKKEIAYTTKFRIIICTLITAGRFIEAPMSSIRKKSNYQNHTFTHLFIDEAGQASEPETLVPICGLLKDGSWGSSGGQLIFAGDPKQLGPVCNGVKAKKFGLGVSLMERLMANMPIYQPESNGEYWGRFITQLVKNFRSHKDILDISNNLFYNNTLLPQGIQDELCTASLLANSTTKGFPIIFHGVEGIERKEDRSPSIYNKDEIVIIVDYIKKLLNCNIRNKVEPEEIGVIAPYALQVHKLKEEFRKHPGWSSIQVGSTEVFQGREKRAIIVSTVRSQPWKRGYDRKFKLGFIKEPKRFNVIMTRAQSKLIVVGNPNVLKVDRCWSFVIKKALENNSYRGFQFKM